MKNNLSNIDELIKKYPLNPNYYLKKADIFDKRGMKKEAVDNYLKSASLFLKQGYFRKPLAVYRILTRIDPDNTEANVYIKSLTSNFEERTSPKISRNEFFSAFTDVILFCCLVLLF